MDQKKDAARWDCDDVCEWAMRCGLGDHGVARPGVDTIAALREVSWPKSTAVVQALGPAGGRRTQRPTPEDNGTYTLFRWCINVF